MTMLARLADLVVQQAGNGGTAPGGGSPFGGISGMVMIFLIFGVMYFLLIRPANKQRRQHQELLSALKKDDEVITTGGLWGRIVSLDERIVTLEIADKVKVRVLRDRIAGRWPTANVVQERK